MSIRVERSNTPGWVMALVPALLLAGHLGAQPFVDVFSVNTLASDHLDRYEVTATLPVRLDSARKLILLEPYYVEYGARTAGDRYQPVAEGTVAERMVGMGSGLTYVAPIGRGWELTIAGIARYHWLAVQEKVGAHQFGGALLAGRKVRPNCTLRLGIYANHEAFGWFIVPLFGIDLRINARNNLFGMLPGSLTYEHKVSERLRCGVAFRAYTNSFGTRDGRFIRVDGDPLGAYVDIRATRHLVLRMEGGWCFSRKVRGGVLDPAYGPATLDRHGFADHALGDAAYLRIVFAYRFRLDGPE